MKTSLLVLMLGAALVSTTTMAAFYSYQSYRLISKAEPVLTFVEQLVAQEQEQAAQREAALKDARCKVGGGSAAAGGGESEKRSGSESYAGATGDRIEGDVGAGGATGGGCTSVSRQTGSRKENAESPVDG